LGKVRYIASFDGLRALCITAVIAFHVISSDRPWLNNAARRGWCGVDVFFVLSGFLITWIIAAEIDNSATVNLRRFYARRALRLQPAYLTALLSFAALLFVFNRAHFNVLFRAFPFFLSYTLNFALACGYVGTIPFMGAWSLCIEEQFYLGWAWALRRFGTRGCFRAALALTATILVWRTSLYLSYNWTHPWVASSQSVARIYYGTDTRIDTILIGCAAALAPREPVFAVLFERLSHWRWLTATALSTAALIFIWATGGAEKGGWRAATFGYSLMAAGAAMLTIALCLQPRSRLSRFLSWRPLVFVGRISYGIYLFHELLWNALARLMNLRAHAIGTLSQELAALSIVLLGSVILAWVHYRVVEIRFLALRDRFAFEGRRQRPVSAAGPALNRPVEAPNQP